MKYAGAYLQWALEDFKEQNLKVKAIDLIREDNFDAFDAGLVTYLTVYTSARKKLIILAAKFVTEKARDMVLHFSARALNLLCEDLTLSVAEWIHMFFDPNVFVAADSAEALMKMTAIRTDENIGAGLLVHRHLYVRPIPEHGMQDDKVLFRGQLMSPLFGEMNPEAAGLFDLTPEAQLTKDALRKVYKKKLPLHAFRVFTESLRDIKEKYEGLPQQRRDSDELKEDFKIVTKTLATSIEEHVLENSISKILNPYSLQLDAEIEGLAKTLYDMLAGY